MITYLVVTPFSQSASHGINNYVFNLLPYLAKKNVKVDTLFNDKNLSKEDFRIHVKKYVETNYGFEDVIIEAPEVKGATLLLDKKYRTHVRLHTPGAIAQKYDDKIIDEGLFNEEIRAIETATVVSSPSYGLIEELSDKVSGDKFFVYKNPYSNNEITRDSNCNGLDYDVIFMARFQSLKGIEYINPILEKLPETFKVLLMGSGSIGFKLSSKINCRVVVEDHDPSPNRFDKIYSSKHLLQLSKFENCSMVILEGLANHAIVHAWDVGGNKEIASSDVLKISPKGNVDYLVSQLLDSPQVSDSVFQEQLSAIESDFKSGLSSIIDFMLRINDNPEDLIYRGIHAQEDHRFNAKYFSEYKVISHDAVYKKFGDRIFGFSLSNEHIEEMWMPIIEKMGADYLFVSRRPIGFMYKFNSPVHVDKNKYKQLDWIRYPNLLIDEIKKFQPHKILFHNGIHPIYKNVLERVSKAFPNIPIVYSELGWFPQHGNIYFDTKGTNGISNIADFSFEELTRKNYPEYPQRKLLNSETYLIVTQLENDTNMIVNSPRFKSMVSFVEHVLNKLPSEKSVIIKTHPLDNYKHRFDDRFGNLDNVTVMHEGDLDALLSECNGVISINSTVLLQALDYNCNIYAYGNGLLDNKRVSFNLSAEGDISEYIYDYEYHPYEAKQYVKNALSNRQINLESLKELTVSQILEKESFSPLVSAIAPYPNSVEYKKIVEFLNKANNSIDPSKNDYDSFDKNIKLVIENQKQLLKKYDQNIPTESHLLTDNKKSRLIAKLKKDPYLYFHDSKVKLIRPLRFLFKKKA